MPVSRKRKLPPKPRPEPSDKRRMTREHNRKVYLFNLARERAVGIDPRYLHKQIPDEFDRKVAHTKWNREVYEWQKGRTPQ